jgi:Fic family protein
MQDDTSALPPLIKAGLLHVQFESIHPFLDGNGRLGRLLIALYLVDQNVLKEPLLYLSLYFKTHRGDYYKLLQEVRERGTWEAWLEFFLKGVTETANNAFASAMRIVTLFKQDRDRISVWAEHTNSMLRIHELMQAHPFVSAAQVAEKTRLSVPTVNTALAALQNLGVVREVTGKLRGRVFAYQELLKLLDDGTAVSPASS